MNSLMRMFCSCCAVGNNHQRGYPPHHDRKAAMIKSTCIHTMLSPLAVYDHLAVQTTTESQSVVPSATAINGATYPTVTPQDKPSTTV